MRITDLNPDPHNARKRTKRGSQTIAHSLREFGAGRSIVIDKHGTVIAGNGVLESAEAAGITELQVIKSDGSKLIAVQRTDLDLSVDAKAKQLAIADNRTAELAEWVPEVLADMADLDLQPFFNSGELRAITNMGVDANDVNAEYEGMPEYGAEDEMGVRQIIVHFATHEDVTDFATLIGQQFSHRAKFIWHPRQQNADLAGQKYI